MIDEEISNNINHCLLIIVVIILIIFLYNEIFAKSIYEYNYLKKL